MDKINPVLSKELLQRFRGGKGWLILLLYLLVIGALCLGFIYLRLRNSPGYFQPWSSKETFITLCLSQLALLAFITPGLTAGTISGEREKQTLNVLLTTRLTPSGIIMSKMMSSSAFTVLLLVASLPLYNIVFLYGGIAPSQVLGVFGFYLITMFLFATIGITCSCLFKKTGISTVTSYGIVFALTAGTGMLAAFIHEIVRRPQPGLDILPQYVPLYEQLLWDINPIVVIMRILGEGGPGPERPLFLPYWGIYTLVYIIVGAALLYWSARLINPTIKKYKPKYKFR